MIRFLLTTEDLSHIRFAFSPLQELTASVRVLRDPARHSAHLPWVAEARRSLKGLDLEPLFALVQPRGYVPDFLTPPPSTPFPDFDEELAAVRRTDPETVRREVGWAYEHEREVPPAAARFRDLPEPALARLADLLAAYWAAALEPHWPRMRALLEGDVLHRGRTLAFSGPGAMFADLHPAVRYAPGRIEIDRPYEASVELAGRGLLLVPSVFAWPDVFVTFDEPWQPGLAYSPRGVGTLWLEEAAAGPEALARLMGTGRAAVLAALEAPNTTGALSRILSVTPGAVSQHLSALRAAGLVEPHRVGRHVFHRLSPRGAALLELFAS